MGDLDDDRREHSRNKTMNRGLLTHNCQKLPRQSSQAFTHAFTGNDLGIFIGNNMLHAHSEIIYSRLVIVGFPYSWLLK